MRIKINNNIVYAVLYSLIVAAARFKLDFALLTFTLGAILGSVILKSDYLFQAFLVQPDLEVSKEAKRLLKEGKYLPAIKTVYGRKSEIHDLTFRTIFFQIFFYFFSFFVVTSSGSAFGKGLVLSALMCLLNEQIIEIRSNKELSSGWFQRINIKLTVKGQKIYIGIASILFVMYTIIYI